MIKSLVLSLSVAAVGTAYAADWQHNHPQFDPTGKVTLGTLAGVTSQLSNVNQQGLQSSASPTILSVSKGGSLTPVFGLRIGTAAGDPRNHLVYIDDIGFIALTEQGINDAFDYEIANPTEVLSTLEANFTVLQDAYINCTHPFYDKTPSISVRVSYECRANYMDANFDIYIKGSRLFSTSAAIVSGSCEYDNERMYNASTSVRGADGAVVYYDMGRSYLGGPECSYYYPNPTRVDFIYRFAYFESNGWLIARLSDVSGFDAPSYHAVFSIRSPTGDISTVSAQNTKGQFFLKNFKSKR